MLLKQTISPSISHPFTLQLAHTASTESQQFQYSLCDKYWAGNCKNKVLMSTKKERDGSGTFNAQTTKASCIPQIKLYKKKPVRLA